MSRGVVGKFMQNDRQGLDDLRAHRDRLTHDGVRPHAVRLDIMPNQPIHGHVGPLLFRE
jgi:hypothetical protein